MALYKFCNCTYIVLHQFLVEQRLQFVTQRLTTGCRGYTTGLRAATSSSSLSYRIFSHVMRCWPASVATIGSDPLRVAYLIQTACQFIRWSRHHPRPCNVGSSDGDAARRLKVNDHVPNAKWTRSSRRKKIILPILRLNCSKDWAPVRTPAWL